MLPTHTARLLLTDVGGYFPSLLVSARRRSMLLPYGVEGTLTSRLLFCHQLLPDQHGTNCHCR